MKNNIAININRIIGIVILLLVIGFTMGYLVAKQTGNMALEAKLQKARAMFPPMPDSNFIFGTVKSVNGQVITLNTPTRSPFDESPEVRQVTVTKSTKIIKNEPKSSEVTQKENEEYRKKMSSWKPGSAETMPTPPMPFTEKEISISEIKEGYQISVEATSKVGMLSKFEAKKITMQIAGVAMMTPPPSATPPTSPVIPVTHNVPIPPPAPMQ